MSNNAPNMKSIVNKADNAIEGIKKPTFLFTVALTYVSYIFIFLGISYLLPTYIRSISNVLHVVICLFLIYKFNPLRSVQQITETDKNLIFFAAIFIIMSTSITEFTISFFDSMKQVLKKDLSSSMY
jgi:hypothetical protein